MAVISRFDNATSQNIYLRKFDLPRPLKEGDPYELEWRVIGQTLTAKLNGELLGSVDDSSYRTGSFGMGVSDQEGAPTLVKSLEILDLDATAGASALPSGQAPAP